MTSFVPGPGKAVKSIWAHREHATGEEPNGPIKGTQGETLSYKSLPITTSITSIFQTVTSFFQHHDYRAARGQIDRHARLLSHHSHPARANTGRVAGTPALLV